MKYTMKNGRTVVLYNELVDLYKNLSPLADCTFEMNIISKYGRIPSEDEVSNYELSILCNETLVEELQTAMLIPKALNFSEKYMDKINSGIPLEIKLEQK